MEITATSIFTFIPALFFIGITIAFYVKIAAINKSQQKTNDLMRKILEQNGGKDDSVFPL